MIDIIKHVVLKKNYLARTKLERSRWNLCGISRTVWDSKRDKFCFNLFYFWIGMKCTGHSGQNEIDNIASNK